MEHELRVLVSSLTEAGGRLLHMAEQGFAVHTKSDHSPVTTADLEVNHLIHEAIRQHFPEDGWLSEEEPDDNARLQKKRVWILDPIDGTRAFIKNVPQFCIAAALVENGYPVIAAILNPATGELFTATRGAGIQLTGALVSSPDEQTPERPVVLVNPWELQAGRFRSLAPQIECRPMGSIAYALALVATGRADAAITLTGEANGMWRQEFCWSKKVGERLLMLGAGASDSIRPTFVSMVRLLPALTPTHC